MRVQIANCGLGGLGGLDEVRALGLVKLAGKAPPAVPLDAGTLKKVMAGGHVRESRLLRQINSLMRTTRPGTGRYHVLKVTKADILTSIARARKRVAEDLRAKLAVTGKEPAVQGLNGFIDRMDHGRAEKLRHLMAVAESRADPYMYRDGSIMGFLKGLVAEEPPPSYLNSKYTYYKDLMDMDIRPRLRAVSRGTTAGR